MSVLNEIETGMYEKKQILSESRLISWSHRSRFKYGIEKALAQGGKSILDYGCGDGTFLKLIHGKFSKLVGVDIEKIHIEDCRERLATDSAYNFLLVDELMEHDQLEQFDVVTCMETLEHCTDEAVDVALQNCNKVMKKDGLFLVSVPIEIGPSLIAKQAARKIAGFKNIGDYKEAFEKYSKQEFMKMVFAGPESGIPRERMINHYSAYGHKGFNWKKLKVQIQKYFQVKSVHFTPIPLTGKFLNSQVWFECEHKDS